MKMNNYKFKRIIAIVLDSVGVGAAPDAYKYGDLGSDTFGNIAKAVGGLNMPNIATIGMGNLHPIKG
jgi:phosphopentomutase